jgi:N-acetyl-gamma-glutamyl-phosphate reductase
MIRAGIYGATGWRGLELVKLLAAHPQVAIQFATSREHAGELLSDVYPRAPQIALISIKKAVLTDVDVVFLALPHATAAPIVQAAVAADVRVVDLSADFRLRSPAEYSGWYGHDHLAPELLGEAVYGLTEYARPELAEARLVACPGSYATSVLLALTPLLKKDVVNGTIVADCKAGVSNAGRYPSVTVDYMELVDNFVPYDIGRNHRHLPEMEQFMFELHPEPPALIFSPHLMPIPRGLLSTVYVPLKHTLNERAVRAIFADAYRDEPFVTVLPDDKLSTVAHVRHTNVCALGMTITRNAVVITSAIDNLLKGAGGQAVQNMNVMFGLDERLGLPGS